MPVSKRPGALLTWLRLKTACNLFVPSGQIHILGPAFNLKYASHEQGVLGTYDIVRDIPEMLADWDKVLAIINNFQRNNESES